MHSAPHHIAKKSAAWHRHGKHAALDPRLIARDRRRPAPEMLPAERLRALFTKRP